MTIAVPNPVPPPIPASMPPSDTASSGGFVYACSDCAVAAGPYPTRGEADLLAGAHDTLHHHGRPTACVSGQDWCESCRRRPAVTSWHHPAAGAPFALCRACAPVDDGELSRTAALQPMAWASTRPAQVQHESRHNPANGRDVVAGPAPDSRD